MAVETPTVADPRKQLRELIDSSPRNDHIIQDGDYCRSVDFLTQFSEEEVQQLIRIYTDHEPNVRPGLLATKCEASFGLYFRTKETSHLPKAVAFGSLIAYHVSLEADNSDRGVLLSIFARSLLVQWQYTHSDTPSDGKLLDDSIYYCHKAVGLGPLEEINRALHFYDLGDQLTARYAARHDATDFAEAEDCFQQASTLRPAGQPIFLFRWARLLRERDEFEHRDKNEMLRTYMGKLKEAVTSETNAFRPTEYRTSLSTVWWHFGYAFWERSELTQNPDDLKHAAGCFGQARLAPVHGSVDRFRACQDLGRVNAIRFMQNGNLEDGNAAVEMLNEALKIQPDSSLAMESLGNHLRVFAEYTNSDEMLTESAEILGKAVRASTQPSESICHAHAVTLMEQFQRSAKIEDIDEAIQWFRTLVDLPFEDEEKHARYPMMLSQCLLLRYKAFGQQDDLDTAQSEIDRVISSSTISESLRGECLHVHGLISFARYHTSNQVEALNQAITQYEEALSKPGNDGKTTYSMHNDLANAYYFKFKISLLVEDLSASIRGYQSSLKALEESGLENAKRANLMVTHGLAISLTAQFEITQQQRDIDRAVECYQKCLQGATKKTLQYVTRATNLSSAYQERYKLTKQISDVKQSQSILLEVLEWKLDLPADHRSNMCNHLGRAYLFSFIEYQEPIYLDYAKEQFQNALSSGSTRHAFQLAASVNLARVLRYKARQTKDVKDQIAALAQMKDNLERLKPLHDSSQRVHQDAFMYNFLDFILDTWEDSGYNATSMFGQMYLGAVLTILPKMKALQVSAIVRLYIYAALAQHIVAKKPEEARNMIRAAAELLPKAILLSFDRKDILNNLDNFVALPSFTIAYSLEAGDPPSQALQLFDKVRSVMWNHVLCSQLTLQGKRIEDFPALQVKLEKMQKPLSKAKARQTKNALAGDIGESLVQQHEVYCESLAYQEILDESKKDPELEGFLRLPGDTSDLIEYAQEGPIIIVNHGLFRSDAIIVTTDGVNSLRLPMLEGQSMTEREEWYTEALHLMSSDLPAATWRLEQVLEWLWDAIAEPILQYLGFNGEMTADSELPRTWWITTGRIGTFPIHAAGNSKKGPNCTVMCRTVPSYTNSLRALVYTRSRRRTTQVEPQSRTEKRALLISMETTPEMGDDAHLPNAELEITSIQGIVDSRGGKSKVLLSPNRDVVLRHLRRADFAHFACHGVCDGDDPARSALRLMDWSSKPLDVRCLLQQGDLDCQLVYLSACESASNKSKFRDEGLHLAGGFQMAGVPHVIASLWRVDDSFSVDIAERFYKVLGALGTNLDSSQSAKALQRVILELRASGVSPVFWASYIHMGP
jgi:tetratricopeptide (TPR) repeat protein